jgi:hypothetical protein
MPEALIVAIPEEESCALTTEAHETDDESSFCVHWEASKQNLNLNPNGKPDRNTDWEW